MWPVSRFSDSSNEAPIRDIRISYIFFISQPILFARVSSHVDDFNTRNKVLTAKILRQGYRYHENTSSARPFIT